ncbi:MAG: 23S rRNA pseudouridine(2605) synthase RluB [Gammaproteobacteria bacterium]|nr:23S rRNA pseudouridine(2605) synthase RluB [Gammaproteobacteria bacterium]
MSEKLQKVLARAGQGSRRELEKVIGEGRVSVNGEVVALGCRVEPTDTVRVDGITINTKDSSEQICRVITYHKQEGEMCTRVDPEGRQTVFDRLPKIKDGRWVAIGRLDINTSGLLLFTNDGELANRLMHPSHEVEREYAVRTFGDVSEKTIQVLRTGVMLEDGRASFSKIKDHGGEGKNSWYHVTLAEGRNREVRRMWESQDVQVSRLIRVRYGDITLEKSLPRGGWQELELDPVNYLRKMVGLDEETNSFLALREEHRNKSARIRRAVRRHAAIRKIKEDESGGRKKKAKANAGANKRFPSKKKSTLKARIRD